MAIELRAFPFEDKPDEEEPGGGYAYYYAGWIYELLLDDRVYLLRRYSDEPDRVSFQGVLEAPTKSDANRFGSSQRIRGGVPYDDPAFVEAALWLLDQPGIKRLCVLTSDPEFPEMPYVPVDPAGLTEPGRTAVLERRYALVAGNITKVSDLTFRADVLNSDQPVLVAFVNAWCPLCQQLTPVLEDVAETYGEHMTVATVDLDDNVATARAQGVTSRPTMVLFVDGVARHTIVGAKPKSFILSELAGALSVTKLEPSTSMGDPSESAVLVPGGGLAAHEGPHHGHTVISESEWASGPVSKTFYVRRQRRPGDPFSS